MTKEVAVAGVGAIEGRAAKKESSNFHTRIRDEVLEYHRQRKLNSEGLAIYIHLLTLAKIRSNKYKLPITKTKLSNQDIANYCKVSISSVKRALATLKKLKVIDTKINKIKSFKGKWDTNHRTITFLISAYKERPARNQLMQHLLYEKVTR